MTSLCKYGEILKTERIADRVYFSARRTSNMLHEAEGADVGVTTIKAHRAKLCRCFAIYDAAEPGPTDEATLPKPRLDMDDSGGTLVAAPRRESPISPSEAELLAEFDLDAADWQVTTIGKSKQQANSGEWFVSHRASFKPRISASHIGMTGEEMETVIAKHAGQPRVNERVNDGSAFLAPAGDLQVGKIDGGGTRGILDRFVELTLQVRDDFNVKRKHEGLTTIVAPWLGDCIEGIVSQGGKLAGRQDLWVTEEVRLIQRLIMLQVETFAPICQRLIVPVVPGNHDESTRFISTGGTDSWAVHAGSSVWDTIQKVREYAPGTFDNVEFVFPQRGELTVTIDVCGSRVVSLHGHQFRGGITGAEKWLAGHSLGRQPQGDADVLLCAHLHHFHAKEVGQGQLVCQIPAIDGGSDWFRQLKGESNPAGMVSLITKNGAWRGLTRYTETGAL